MDEQQVVNCDVKLNGVLKKVLHNAIPRNGLVRGMKSSVRELECTWSSIEVCILAQDCNFPARTEQIRALCEKRAIPLTYVQSQKVLADWAFPYGYGAYGRPVALTCSCVLVTNWGRQTGENDEFRHYLDNNVAPFQ